MRPVKLFAFILAMIVAVQSMMPCTDSSFALGHGKAKAELVKAVHTDDNQKIDDCSPFCQCACCGSYSTKPATALVRSVIFQKQKPSPATLPSATIEVALPIWQPPQLS